MSRPANGKSSLSPFKTVQEGINAASDGDTVLVRQATYYERISFNGKNIVLTSTSPADTAVRNLTIIDGNQAGSVVRFSGTEDGTCVLTGFTIRRGLSTYWAGGIDGRATKATIENNLITGNRGKFGGGISEVAGLIQNNFIIGNSANFGGGLYICRGTIQDNTISGNTGDDGGGLTYCTALVRRNRINDNGAIFGAGLYSCSGEIVDNEIAYNRATRGAGLASCVATIKDNVITENHASEQGGGLLNCYGEIIGNTISLNSSAGSGGGLAGCDAPITDNTILTNWADQHGGALYSCGGIISNNLIHENWCKGSGGGLADCHGTIERNTITENSAEGFGGGISYCNGPVRNNVIAGNTVGGVLGHGGGLANCLGNMENNTVVGNTAALGGGFYDCDGVVMNCIICANTATEAGPQLYSGSIPTYSCIQSWTGGGQGNTAIFPVFVDADGPDNDINTYDDNNYRLSLSHGIPNACIDNGKNETWMQGAKDRDGNLRVYYGLSSMTVDMGAFEYGSWKFKIAAVAMSAVSEVQLSWPSRIGDQYVVWSTLYMRGPGLIPPPWEQEATLTAVETTTLWTDPQANGAMKFYRIEEVH